MLKISTTICFITIIGTLQLQGMDDLKTPRTQLTMEINQTQEQIRILEQLATCEKKYIELGKRLKKLSCKENTQRMPQEDRNYLARIAELHKTNGQLIANSIQKLIKLTL